MFKRFGILVWFLWGVEGLKLPGVELRCSL